MVNRLLAIGVFFITCAVSPCFAGFDPLKNLNKFVGAHFGEPYKAISKRVRKGRMVGPGKAILDLERGLEASSFRVTKGVVPKSGVTSTMLFFSSKGLLAGYDIILRSDSTAKEFERTLVRSGFAKDDTGNFQYTLVTGPHTGSKVTFKRTTIPSGKRKKRIIFEGRCLDILMFGNENRDAVIKKRRHLDDGGGNAAPENAVRRAL